MAERIIKCVGRRRLTVTPTENGAVITVWLKDPPTGRRIAGLPLEIVEVEKLVLSLVEVLSNA